jgi:phosphotriesterase-related protein
MPREIITIAGPIPPEQLGMTMMHEHIVMDIRHIWQDPQMDDYVLDELAVAEREVREFVEAGGRTIVDVTNISMPRRLAQVAEIARRTGVQVIAATGYYVERSYPEYVQTASVEQLAEIMLAEIAVGMDGTAMRAGIIGEIASGPEALSPLEQKVFRAAARAQRASGLALTTHTTLGLRGLDQLHLLLDEGVDPGRVVIGHLDSRLAPANLAEHREIARLGAYVQYDGVGHHYYSAVSKMQFPSDDERVAAIRQLLDWGFHDRILLSSDTCRRRHLKAHGGCGYDHVVRNFRPLLEASGISREAIDAMLIVNPRRVLSGE